MKNILTKNTILLLLLIAVITLVTFLLVTNNSNTNKNSVLSVDELSKVDQLPTLTLSSDYAVAGNTDDLMKLATNVVVGYYGEFVEIWDMGERYYSEVYTFQVEEVIKGEVTDQIKVAIPKNRIKLMEYDGKNYDINIDLPHYFKPEANEKVILFLSDKQAKNIYSPASLPFQIGFTVDGKSELLWRKTEKQNTQLLKIENNKNLQVISEQNDVEAIDEITGMEKESLLSILRP